MKSMIPPGRLARLLLLAQAAFLAVHGLPAAAQSPSSILIWPVNPVIEGQARATALWLENPGKSPITLQVRIYAWTQRENQNLYAETREVIGSPPIVTIEPGARQLVRITRLVAPPPSGEQPYRIIVDEVPVKDGPGTAGASVTFRMRYSLPLFSEAKQEGGAERPTPPAAAIAWRTGAGRDGPFLEIRNSGSGHARLSDVAFTGGRSASVLGEGLFGYVLPGATMRWPLPSGVDGSGDLVAAVNGRAQARIERLPE